MRNRFFVQTIRTVYGASKSKSWRSSWYEQKIICSSMEEGFANLALPSCLFGLQSTTTLTNCPPVVVIFVCSYLLDQIAGLLIGSLAVSGTRLQGFGESAGSGLVVTLHGTHKGLSGNPAHPIPFDVVQHLGRLSLHLRVEGIRLGLDCCARHCGFFWYLYLVSVTVVWYSSLCFLSAFGA